MNVEGITKNTIGKTSSLTSASILKTGLWILTLLLLPQMISGVIFGVYNGAIQGNNFSQQEFEQWFSTVPVLLTFTLLSWGLTFPLLIKATPKQNNNRLTSFWVLGSIERKPLVNWLVIGLFYWLFSTIVGYFLALPVEPFMLDIKVDSTGLAMQLYVFSMICLLVPICEEVLFRGWMFSRIKLTKLGNMGALVITSLVFTLIHAQYEHIGTFALLFGLGLLLGFIRYKSNNVNYAIAVHILFNCAAMTSLYFI